MEISGIEVFKEKVEKSIGRSISISELMVAINDPGIIDSVVSGEDTGEGTNPKWAFGSLS